MSSGGTACGQPGSPDPVRSSELCMARARGQARGRTERCPPSPAVQGREQPASGREAPVPAPSQLGDQPLLLEQPLVLVLPETQAQRPQKWKN